MIIYRPLTQCVPQIVEGPLGFLGPRLKPMQPIGKSGTAHNVVKSFVYGAQKILHSLMMELFTFQSGLQLILNAVCLRAVKDLSPEQILTENVEKLRKKCA